LEKNVHVERADGKQKLHGSKMRGSEHSRLESWSVIDLMVTAEDWTGQAKKPAL